MMDFLNAESLLGKSYVFSDDKNARDENDIVSLRLLMVNNWLEESRLLLNRPKKFCDTDKGKNYICGMFILFWNLMANRQRC